MVSALITPATAKDEGKVSLVKDLGGDWPVKGWSINRVDRDEKVPRLANPEAGSAGGRQLTVLGQKRGHARRILGSAPVGPPALRVLPALSPDRGSGSQEPGVADRGAIRRLRS
jgi:hypothetical protein